MKRLFSILVMLITVSASAQWVQMSNGITAMVGGFTSIGTDIYTGTYWVVDNNSNALSAFGVYRSTNNGLNWIQTSFAYRVLSLHAKGSRLFACTYSEGTYYSDNFGANWINMNMYAYSFASNNTYLFASTGSGLLVSTNDGLNWSTINSAYGSMLVKDNYICVYNNSASIKVSSNNGTNWTNANGISNSVYCMATNGTEIYAGTYGGGVLKSTDNGYNFTQTTAFNGNMLQCLLANGSNVIAGDNSTGVFVSSNKGTTWTQRNQGLTGSNSVGRLYFLNGYVFAALPSVVWRRDLQNLVSVNSISEILPSSYSLSQNYPNPFNPITNVKFSIVKSGDVKIVVYDVQGREVQTLVNERLSEGSYEVSFDGSMLTSGVYFYKMVSEGFTEIKRMILIK